MHLPNLKRARRLRAEIADLVSSTSVNEGTGALDSVQRADMVMDTHALDELWTPRNLERLGRTYWRFLTRVTLGIVRVIYTQHERSVVLLIPQLKLLTFRAPEYETSPERGLVRWRIASGLLVSREGRDLLGYLQIEVRRHPGPDPQHARLDVEVTVANFHPSIATRLGQRLYEETQSRIHVIVTYGFLRSLRRLDLAPSRVGHFDGP